MYTNYDNGFTEALIRNLTDERFDAFAADVRYDTTDRSFGRELRFAWPGTYPATIVAHCNRGVLLLDDLHVPLATELSAAMQRLADIERIIRSSLPDALRQTELLSTALVVYADRWDVVPKDCRIIEVVSEEQPERTLQPLFEQVLPAIADPDEVADLAAAVANEWHVTQRAHALPPVIRDVA